MFKKLVAIEPLNLVPLAEKELHSFADEVIVFNHVPADAEEISQRIGDADCVLLSYTSQLGEDALKNCPNVKYIGMCCSLYSPESANVAIEYAEGRGITVTGIRDYGDEGVVEYVVSELIRCLHGFGNDNNGQARAPWDGVPREITGLKVGIVGLGKSGGMVADALQFFGAKISYFSRTRKPDEESKGFEFLPLKELLETNEVIITCLNKNTVLLNEAEFEQFGNRKILINTGLSPAWEDEAFKKWIDQDNLCYCDTIIALGDESLVAHPNIYCMQVSAGRTRQAFNRLSEKVLNNIKTYLKKQ